MSSNQEHNKGAAVTGRAPAVCPPVSRLHALRPALRDLTVVYLLFFCPNLIYSLHNHHFDLAGQGMQLLVNGVVATLPYLSPALLVLALAPGKWGRTLVAAQSIMVALLAWVGVAHLIIYGHGIGPASVYVALSSNPAEASEYLSLYGSVRVFAWLALLLGLQAVTCVFLFSQRRAFHGRRAATVLAAFFLAPLSCLVWGDRSAGAGSDNFALVYANAAWAYRLDEMRARKLRASAGETQPVRVTRTARAPQGVPETYVLVIGESTSRAHMGLYGYRRDTNPLLGSLVGELTLFDNMVSADMLTSLCLQKLLTPANTREPGRVFEPHMLDVVKAGGFRSYWLSNQRIEGSGEIWNKYFSESADVRFLTDTSAIVDARTSYDETLLKPFAKVVNDGGKKKFIVLHLMGAHLNARMRYPERFQRFTHSAADRWVTRHKRKGETYDYIDWYDNAVLYNDYVVHSIINILKQGNGARLMLYLSDHGEEVGDRDDFIGRGGGSTSNRFEIPFIVWMSPEYAAARPELVQELPHAARRPCQVNGFIHTLMDFTGVWTDAYDPARSVVSPSYAAGARLVDGADYETMRAATKAAQRE
ncbi:sulfatase-like hydrolase/transferase [Geomonas edaphica]|uniref:sulfatase-like hydrolase/transferase n=1 Tax=Geomonas edaphica TaxID=2570226 RepID=UPI0013A5CC40|nr:sulfatase-like hydrolase/transferase [Geomonas edaphica]